MDVDSVANSAGLEVAAGDVGEDFARLQVVNGRPVVLVNPGLRHPRLRFVLAFALCRWRELGSPRQAMEPVGIGLANCTAEASLEDRITHLHVADLLMRPKLLRYAVGTKKVTESAKLAALFGVSEALLAMQVKRALR